MELYDWLFCFYRFVLFRFTNSLQSGTECIVIPDMELGSKTKQHCDSRKVTLLLCQYQSQCCMMFASAAAAASLASVLMRIEETNNSAKRFIQERKSTIDFDQLDIEELEANLDLTMFVFPSSSALSSSSSLPLSSSSSSVATHIQSSFTMEEEDEEEDKDEEEGLPVTQEEKKKKDEMEMEMEKQKEEEEDVVVVVLLPSEVAVVVVVEVEGEEKVEEEKEKEKEVSIGNVVDLNNFKLLEINYLKDLLGKYDVSIVQNLCDDVVNNEINNVPIPHYDEKYLKECLSIVYSILNSLMRMNWLTNCEFKRIYQGEILFYQGLFNKDHALAIRAFTNEKIRLSSTVLFIYFLACLALPNLVVEKNNKLRITVQKPIFITHTHSFTTFRNITSNLYMNVQNPSTLYIFSYFPPRCPKDQLVNCRIIECEKVLKKRIITNTSNHESLFQRIGYTNQVPAAAVAVAAERSPLLKERSLSIDCEQLAPIELLMLNPEKNIGNKNKNKVEVEMEMEEQVEVEEEGKIKGIDVGAVNFDYIPVSSQIFPTGSQEMRSVTEINSDESEAVLQLTSLEILPGLSIPELGEEEDVEVEEEGNNQVIGFADYISSSYLNQEQEQDKDNDDGNSSEGLAGVFHKATKDWCALPSSSSSSSSQELFCSNKRQKLSKTQITISEEIANSLRPLNREQPRTIFTGILYISIFNHKN